MKYYYQYTEEDCKKVAREVLERYKNVPLPEMLVHWSSSLHNGAIIAGLMLLLKEAETP